MYVPIFSEEEIEKDENKKGSNPQSLFQQIT